MDLLDKVNQISTLAGKGSAISIALGGDDQFETLRKNDLAYIIGDLQQKFEEIETIAESIGTRTTDH
jgi:hypothetical protein